MIQFWKMRLEGMSTSDFLKKSFSLTRHVEKCLFSFCLYVTMFRSLLWQPSCDNENGIMAMFRVADITIETCITDYTSELLKSTQGLPFASRSII